MASKYTKKSRRKYYFLCLLSLICVFGPLGYYCGVALLSTGLVVSKMALVGSVVVVGIMTALSLANIMVPRSRVFIILIALYFCLDSIAAPLLLVGFGQIFDELIITPAKNNAKTELIANKVQDKREFN